MDEQRHITLEMIEQLKRYVDEHILPATQAYIDVASRFAVKDLHRWADDHKYMQRWVNEQIAFTFGLKRRPHAPHRLRLRSWRH